MRNFLALVLLLSQLFVLANNNGNGLLFDGSDDYIDLSGTGDEITLSSTWSLSVWVNPQSGFSGGQSLLGKHNSNKYHLGFWTGGDEIRYYNNGTPAYISTDRPSGLSIDTWYHLTIVKDGNTTMRVYVDGIESSDGQVTVDGGSITFTIIGRRHSNLDYLNGVLDDFVIWDNTIISASEAALLAEGNDPSIVVANNPTRWYKFDESTGNSANDHGSDAIDATLQDFPTDDNQWVEGAVSYDIPDSIVNNYDEVLYVHMNGVDSTAVLSNIDQPWGTPHVASVDAHTLAQSDTLSYLIYVRKGTYEDYNVTMPGIDMYFEEDAVVWFNTDNQSSRPIISDHRGGAGEYNVAGKGRFYVTTVAGDVDKDAVNFRYNSTLYLEAKELNSIQLWSNFDSPLNLNGVSIRTGNIWTHMTSTLTLDSCSFPLGYHQITINTKGGKHVFNNCKFFLPSLNEVPDLFKVVDHNGDSLFIMSIATSNYQYDTEASSVEQLANEQYGYYYSHPSGDKFNVISSFEIRPPQYPWLGWSGKSLNQSYILNNPMFYVNRENGFAFRIIWNESDPNRDYTATGIQINGGKAIKGDSITNAIFRQDDKLDSVALDVPVNINGVTFEGFIPRVFGLDFFPMNFSNLPPTKSKNFIRVETPRVEISDENYFATASYKDKVTSFDYSDGLGRSLQSVVIKSSPGGLDIIDPTAYNPLTGRQDKSYLPFTYNDSIPGAFLENSISNQETFYNSGLSDIVKDSIPYTYSEYENSPLSRIEASTGTGYEWHSSEKKTEYDYIIHDGTTGSDKVIKWEIITNANKELEKPRQNTSKPYYGAGELSISQVTNEEGIITQRITDSRGFQIAVRTKKSSSWVTTYNVYDKLGQLRFIIPPVLADTLNPSDNQVNGLMFQYIYDDRGRLIKERSPDMGWKYYCYDQWDRLVATQDVNHRQADLWLYRKYDKYNRIIMTGRETDSRSQTALQNDIMSDTVRFENISTDSIGYTINRTWPFSNTDLLTITYYDNYDYVDNTGWDGAGINYEFVTDGLNIEKTTFSNRGLVTGSKVKVLGTDNWLNTVTYYDKYSRTIQVIAENHLGGYDRISTEYNFAGEVLQTKLSHSRTPSGTDLTYLQEYAYDDRGRTTDIWNKLNEDPKILVANYSYNELGELIEKNLHSIDEGDTYLQSIDYQFNIRGWMETINTPDLSADSTSHEDNADLFGAKYHYTTTNTIGESSISGRYDGLLAALEWKNSNNGASSFNQSVFGYEYDDLNRLTQAKYATGTSDPFSDHSGHYDVAIGYKDNNGNIGSLVRKEENVTIDSLSYQYSSFTNQIDSVIDLSDNLKGFADHEIPGGPYTYDDLGSLTSDLNKDIVAFEYNHLNLLTRIEFYETGEINYTYDAVGNRLSKTLEDGDGNILYKIDYVGLVEYRNDSIYQIFTDAGRAYEQNGSFHYEYFIKDHQGSNRVSFGILPDRKVYSTTIEKGSDDLFFDIPSATVLSSISPNLNHTPGGTKVNHLDGSASKVVGAAIVIPVSTGDIINIEAWAMYTNDASNGSSQSLLPLILSSFSAGADLAGIGETASNGISSTINSTTGILEAFGGSNKEPSAYLNYLFFDSSYDFVLGSSNYLSVTDQYEDAYEKLSSGEITISEDGYLYVYVANEEYNGYNVYFDDIQITHESPATSYKVTEVNDYYPFGMRMATSWSEDGYLSPGLYYQGSFTVYDSLLDHYEFIARNYDPTLGRFISVDPAGQFASPYVGIGNNPVCYIDPTGEFVWLIPQIGWSKEGGLSIGLSLVVGIPGVASAQVGGGYNFKSNEGYGYAGATAGFNTVYTSYSPSGGWNVGYTAGASIYSGLPISTNFLTVGTNYNISHNQWSGNASAWQIDQRGVTFNPSVNVMVAPEQTTNLVRGQGFRSNNKVLAGFVDAGNYQGALDYFGFKGTYGGEGMSSTFRNRRTGESGITYRDDAFNSYGDMMAVYKKESFHLRRVRNGGWELGDTDSFADARQPEERLGLIHQYKNAGFYRNVPGFLSRISRIEGLIDMYNPSSPGGTDGLYGSYYHYTPYQPKWWHGIYRIPRVY